jgi:hypothetical protein
MADSNAHLQKIAQQHLDQGRLIEAGWLSLRVICLHPDTPAQQLEDMRMAFFAGAHHLFFSIIAAFEDGTEPSEADMRRMSSADTELREFMKKFAEQHGIKTPTEH